MGQRVETTGIDCFLIQKFIGKQRANTDTYGSQQRFCYGFPKYDAFTRVLNFSLIEPIQIKPGEFDMAIIKSHFVLLHYPLEKLLYFALILNSLFSQGIHAYLGLTITSFRLFSSFRMREATKKLK